MKTTTDIKQLFFDKDLRTGGFYELSIQVCPSVETLPIKVYTDYIWNLPFVYGPFDIDFNKIEIDINNFEHQGVMHLGQYIIPFKTFNIREEEPIETGFNWFDICFYTAAIEKVFGEQYQTWTESPKVPKPLEEFLLNTMKSLYRLHPFQLAIIDFEVSGQYYFNDLKGDFLNWTSSKFFVGKENIGLISEKNKNLVTVVD
ncbi:hypothetical protein [Pontibacter lucknowensis]|uniref:Uncharacterized protein n=1 Tax=Pontibacter lucknowensis TaxID=1077936 RepID=A0A1N7BGB9_9BACT|nr:hypothetical protein [Pontibacter lucknowensis]SIR50397.1 hypothetical protein SAMN05421545_3957 [Pontibacter lucknowensis]